MAKFQQQEIYLQENQYIYLNTDKTSYIYNDGNKLILHDPNGVVVDGQLELAGQDFNTDIVPEGDDNLYYTVNRLYNSLSPSSGIYIDYDSDNNEVILRSTGDVTFYDTDFIVDGSNGVKVKDSGIDHDSTSNINQPGHINAAITNTEPYHVTKQQAQILNDLYLGGHYNKNEINDSFSGRANGKFLIS